MNFADLSVKTRLLGTIGLLIVALILVSVSGLRALAHVDDDVHKLFEERTRPAVWIGNVYGLQLQAMQMLDLALAQRDPAAMQGVQGALGENRKRVEELMSRWEGSVRSEEARRLKAEIASLRARLVAANDELSSALQRGDFDAALRIRMQSSAAAFEPLRDRIDEALQVQLQEAQELNDDSTAVSRSNRNFVVGLSLFTILSTAALALWLVRSIVASLNAAVAISKRIASGELGQQIEVGSRDEFGVLLGTLKQMDGKLYEIVGEVRNAAEAVGAATSQLSQGNDDLSQRTQEQAAALEETAASMEEMTSTVKQNADNAGEANQLAAGARNQAERGGVIVNRAVEAMAEINSSSRKISDIISVIDEIAFQTNLLALNAAVEAARAGEQGRGFAVVASEVRSLAQRSASAAKEIKELINDSVEKVGVGTTLVDQSGQALGEIMESVKKVSDIVAEIAAASEEQATSIEQVNHAVTQMDESTQQNAALVEEATAASKAMQQQAAQLVSLVGFFRTAGMQLAASRPPVPTSAPSPVPTVKPSIPRASKPVLVRPALAKASGADWQEF